MKRWAKFLISLAVRCWDILAAGGLRLLGRKPRGSCIVLYYHAIPSGQRSRFAAQMDTVIRYTRPIAAGNLQPLEAGHRYSVVTFDDGFISVFDNAVPELASRRIPATVFVPTGSLGGPPLWVKDEGAPARKEIVVSAEDLKKLNGSQLVEIGSHSITHRNLAALEPARARAELAESKMTLENILGKPVPLFSFPHGAHNEGLVRLAREVGYRRVFTISPQPAFAGTDEFVTGRTLTSPADWRLEFTLKLLGAYRWLPAIFAAKQRLLRRPSPTVPSRP